MNLVNSLPDKPVHELFQFLAGLGLFIYAMFLLESALDKLAGRAFKLFLRKHTDNTFKAIASSAITTGILQSSSVVIMMVLAFVGAGIVSMRNALAVTIGSNFGTTLDSWMVASLGFKMDISVIALPIVGVACIALAFLNDSRRIYQYARFVLGFGFLFLGLDFMKESMSIVLKDFDFTQYQDYPRIVFVLIGFVITALIQSSSATMAILLSALNTGAIPFEAAVAAVIGSELGTTVKIVAGSLNGIAAKRQLAVGNVLFNVVICIIAFIFLDWLIAMTGYVVSKDEILLRLVLFQSSINLVGVILFAPFLNPFAKLLEKYIHGSETPSTFVIGQETLSSPLLGLDALEQDTELLIHRALRLNLEAFAIERRLVHAEKDIHTTLNVRDRKMKDYETRYNDIKKAEGELLVYALKLSRLYPKEQARTEELVSAVRYAMHSAKAMKDVQHNRIEFHESGNNAKHGYYTAFKKQLEELYVAIDSVLKHKPHGPSGYESLLKQVHKDYFERQDSIYAAARDEKLTEEDLSSLLNVNRELYTSCKTIILAIELFGGANHHSVKTEEFP